MDLNYIEKMATMFNVMLIEHPELCPHDYEWYLTRYRDDGSMEVYYRCRICGSEMFYIER